MEKFYNKFYKILTIVSSLICIVFFGLAGIEENFMREWRKYQAEFKEILLSSAKTAREKEAAENFSVEIKQVILDDFKRVDRCANCHNGIENPNMADEIAPHNDHSGNYVKYHPVEKFGCTICHAGQGRALGRKGAFATTRDIHWDYPVLSLEYAQSSCGKCHLSVYDNEQQLEGADVLLKGRDIFVKSGCLGCHKTRGTGGIIGTDLTAQGSKTTHDYDFTHVNGARTIPNWLKTHFINPQEVAPGSLMPKTELNEGDLDALVTFTMSLYPPELPIEYYTLDYVEEFKKGRKRLKGEEAYDLYCSYCHGENGEGRDYDILEMFNPALNNEEFLSAASDDFIHYTIRHGRSRLMPSWTYDNGGLADEEIQDLVKMIRGFEPTAPTLEEVKTAKASKRIGTRLYRARCGGCHGMKGEGGIGPALKNQDFLAIADFEYLYETMVRGRVNTAMPSWKWLRPSEFASIILYIEKWRKKKTTLVQLSDERIQGDIANGKSLYVGLCGGCHGTRGEGIVGPALMNPDFLATTKDHFIRESMLRGRPPTAMRSLKKGGGSLIELSDPQMNDIVAYIRSHENQQPNEIISNVVTGTLSTGKLLYTQLCEQCHGKNGKGGLGPALNNPEFLGAATDGFIQAAIVRGRKGTPMRAWGLGTQGLQELPEEMINDITAYISSWRRQKSEPEPAPSTLTAGK
ncbi:MAG: c-type cytochrome [bacterium]|nr:c-type cytochrome [bacterium]